MSAVTSPRQLVAAAAAAALALALLAAPTPIAHADSHPVLTVTVATDNPGAPEEGSLRKAIIDGTTGGVPYEIFINLEDTIELESNLPYLQQNVTIRGISADDTIVDGGGDWSIFRTAGSLSITVSDLTLTGGRGDGGAIYAFDGSNVTITNSTFTGNSTAEVGGAVLVFGNLTVIDSTFDSNEAGDVGGGAIATDGTLEVENSTFSGNTSTGDEGGGAILVAGGGLSVENSTFTGNTADNGGGIAAFVGWVTITGSTFTGNTADDDGGAIFATGGALEITASTFTGNTADNDGGAIAVGGDVTITDSTFTENTGNSDGGAIYADGGEVEITNSTFTDNSTGNEGGAIWADGGDVEITDSTFTENTAAGDDGGGAIWADGVNVSITKSTFTENTATGSKGGAVYHEGGDLLEIHDSVFDRNDATSDGGAVYHEDGDLVIHDSVFDRNDATGAGGAVYDDGDRLVIHDSVFDSNKSLDDFGGAVAAYGQNLEVLRSTFTNNMAENDGGGIDIWGAASTISESTFEGNTAGEQGGAISNFGSGTLSVENSTLSGNTSTLDGGALWFNSLVTLNSVTIVGNTAGGQGGGVFGDNDALTMVNTLLADNTEDNCATDGGDINSGGHNLADDDSCGLGEASDLEDVDDPGVDSDLADNGGPTETHALLAGSPAIDAGSCPDLDTDQRGVDRPQGDACDIGAFEFEPDSGSGGGSSGGGSSTSPDADQEPKLEVRKDAAAGETVSTLPEGGRLSTDVPAGVSVTTPVAGSVSIDIVPDAPRSRTGFSMLGVQVELSAPTASVADPLVVGFVLHESLLEGKDPMKVVPFRNGQRVRDCTDPDGTAAAPDPCVASRTVDDDGQLTIAVRTSAASTWTFGEAAEVAFDAACPPSAFADLAGNAHRDAIDCAAWHGIAKGYADGTYRPAATVRRDQFASFLVRALEAGGYALPAPASAFADVDGNVHADAIRRLTAAGIVQGTTPVTYGPDALVSRAQTAALLVRALDWAGVGVPAGGAGYFPDTAGSVHADAIDAAFELGLTAGVTPDRFAPRDPVGRDQMASFLIRLLDALWGR